jgi:hypothetical protein
MSDKLISILCTTLIALACIWKFGPEAKDVVLPITTGIFGVVTGLRLRSKGSE